MTNNNRTNVDRISDACLPCESVRRLLPDVALGDRSDDHASSDLLLHLTQCRPCLEVYIALQAAAELASPLPAGR